MAGPSTADLVVRNVRLLDEHGPVDLAVTAGVLTEVGRVGETVGAAEVDGHGALATRPFADAHLHLDKAGTAARHRGEADTLIEAIDAMRSLKTAESGDIAGVAARMSAALAGIVAGGTHAVRAVVDIDETWGLTSFHAALVVRAAFADRCTVRVVAFPQHGLTPHIEALVGTAAEEGADAIGAHTDIDDDPSDHVRTAFGIAAAAGLPVEVHTDEGARPDRFFLPLVLDALEDAGDVSATLVHCLSLGTLPVAEQERWICRLAERRIRVCVAPSVLALGVPMGPIRRLIEGGVEVVIVTDNLHDVFNPLGTGRAIENARVASIAGRLTAPHLFAPAVAAVTDLAWSTVTGDPVGLVAGSPATFVVHRATSPDELLRGSEGTALSILDGRQMTGS